MKSTTEMVEGIFNAVQTYVDARFVSLQKQLDTKLADNAGERGEKGDAGERGEKGDAGVDADVASLERTLRGHIDARFELLHQAIQKRIEDAVAAIEIVVPDPIHGKDGTDGRDGRDGRDGVDGRDALDITLLPDIDPAKAYARGTWACWRGGIVVATRNTTPLGTESAESAGWAVVVNGLSALTVSYDGERLFTVRSVLTDGLHEQSFTTPVVLDRGVWDEQRAYDCGDAVTCEGAVWIAQAPSSKMRPGTTDAWRLAVKRGRDGRDATTKDARNGPVSLR